MCLSCEDIARQICAMVPRWRIFGDFLGPAFPASRVQHISDLHSKFALRPHHDRLYKCSAVAEMGDRLATIDMGRKELQGSAVPLSGGNQSSGDKHRYGTEESLSPR